MNSPICITPSRSALALGALLLAACAGDQPDPGRRIDPALPAAESAANAGAEPDKGQGNLTFHYANKTTDANLAIDLSSTDVYLEMTGKTAQEQVDRLRAQEGKEDAHKAGSARKPAAPEEDAKAADPKGDEDGEPSEEKTEPAKSAAAPGKGLHKGPPKKPEPPPEEDPGDYEDVTSKVLSGIRRAQELFYQKQYPEALQAVRSSLDARPTAEGYALMGSIYFMQGQTGMARRQWMEALRLNPDMPAVVNMLEKTRTPGGRGSPSPRPVYHPPARPADPEAPYPEEFSSPAPEAAPTAQPAPAAAPARSAAPAAAPAPAVPAPQPEDDGDEEAEAPAPAVSPAPKAAPSEAAPASQPAAPALGKATAPAQTSAKAPAPAPKPVAGKPAAAKPVREKKP